MRQRSSRETWVERIASWRASGKTAREFAAGQPYTLKTLKWWGNELKQSVSHEPIEMARVEVRPTPRSTIAIEVVGVRVVVEQGFDPSLLRAVIVALREGR
jgi:hypothetical protein